MNIRNIARIPRAALLALLAGAVFALAFGKEDSRLDRTRLSVALLIQEDASAPVAADRDVYRDFIRSLPAGAEVMVAYARVGKNRIARPFTSDLESAAAQVRGPSGLTSLSPGSPYQSIKELLKKFPEDPAIPKILIFVGDGLDRYGPLASTPSANPILEQAIDAAKVRDVRVFTIYAPTAGSRGLQGFVQQGQGGLNYLAEKTGGKAFFSGDTYISAKSFLTEIRGAVAAMTARLKTSG